MDKEKKSEASGDGPEQVGPSQLQEQVPQDDSSRGVLAGHAPDERGAGPGAQARRRGREGLGAAARFSGPHHRLGRGGLLRRGGRVHPEGRGPQQAPGGAAGVHLHALHASNESRPRWRLGLALSGAAVLVVALLPATLTPVAEVRVQEESSEEVWTTDVHVDSVPILSGEAPRPRKNQKRAPCTEGLEVEVSGVCWLPIEKRPCPPQTVAYQGQCLLPVAQPRPPVTSLDGGDGSETH
jgi:hypothetical protein